MAARASSLRKSLEHALVLSLPTSRTVAGLENASSARSASDLQVLTGRPMMLAQPLGLPAVVRRAKVAWTNVSSCCARCQEKEAALAAAKLPRQAVGRRAAGRNPHITRA